MKEYMKKELTESERWIQTYKTVEDEYGKKVIKLIDKICEHTDKVLGDDGSLSLRDELVKAVADTVVDHDDWGVYDEYSNVVCTEDGVSLKDLDGNYIEYDPNGQIINTNVAPCVLEFIELHNSKKLDFLASSN